MFSQQINKILGFELVYTGTHAGMYLLLHLLHFICVSLSVCLSIFIQYHRKDTGLTQSQTPLTYSVELLRPQSGGLFNNHLLILGSISIRITC